MRPLTDDERNLLDKRKAEFDEFLEGMTEDLADFAENLELPEPAMIIAKPSNYLSSISEFMQNQDIAHEHRASLSLDIGFFIGELLNEKLDGTWFLNEWPDTPSFLHYVVGSFEGDASRGTIVDPFEAGVMFIDMPPGRRLDLFVEDLEKKCHRKMAL